MNRSDQVLQIFLDNIAYNIGMKTVFQQIWYCQRHTYRSWYNQHFKNVLIYSLPYEQFCYY